jgi:hypothetical protein
MSKPIVIPFETTLHVRDTCLCLHVPAGHALLSMAVPIWTSTHADVDDALGEGRPDRLRSDLLALA